MIIRLITFVAGAWLVSWTLKSVVRTFVLPRSDNVFLTRFIFVQIFRVFQLRTKRVNTYEARDRVMALFAPIALLATPVVGLILILLGYTAMFWGTGVEPLQEAFLLSGSSLFTLGFARDDTLLRILLTFTEATFGLGFVALLISYLPTMYSAFSERERAVAMLEVRAGDPPSAVEMLKRFHRLNNLAALGETFVEWEVWFANLEETHTSLFALVFFRSPQPERSWVTAAGAILDGGALFLSCLNLPDNSGRHQASLCIRAGYIALRRIGDFFRLQYDPNPDPMDTISVTKSEFLAAYAELEDAGLPLVADVEQAWRDFSGWRVNYDRVLVQLAGLTMAPYAPWSSDRSLTTMPPPQVTVQTQPRIRQWLRRIGNKKAPLKS